MPFDAFFMACVVNELSGGLAGARLDRASCPDKNEIVLSFRGEGGSVSLLLCSRPGSARLHLTEKKRENPETPPVFCMLLRKHLAGARLSSITQSPAERLCDLRFACYDDFGDPTERHIFFECAGKIPNIVFTGADLSIIDCARRINLDESAAGRPMLPGLKYRPPEQPPEKANPFAVSASELSALLSAFSGSAREALFGRVAGMSPFLANELLSRSGLDGDAHVSSLSERELFSLGENLRLLAKKAAAGGEPVLLLKAGGEPRDYSFFVPFGAPQDSFCAGSSFSAMLDGFYSDRETGSALAARAAELSRPVKNALARENRKLHARRSELAQTLDRERLREFGDILSANLRQIPKGAASAVLPDFYGGEGETVKIPLLAELSPQQNAQRYYREYSKKKSAENHLRELISRSEAEIKYLEGLSFHLENAGKDDLPALREELADAGLLKAQPRKKRRKLPPVPPVSRDLGQGFTLLCGRSEAQNEELTFKTAAFNDIWLHAQNVPGSHCILKCGGREAPQEILQRAADLAALYSSVRGSASVPVDFSEVRNIKKQRGGRPGAVIYEKYRTLYSRPAEK